MPGTLFVVATPIGNLEDITARALRVLREATVIAAEDTRRTSHLLARYGITTPTTSLHEHNETRKAAALVARLEQGDSIALVSDAGTPAISDPGQGLIRAAVAAGIRVEPIPGPNAAIAALAVSGLATDAFTFLGFPPARSKDRSDWFARARSIGGTVVFYEAPHRILRTLAELQQMVGDCPVVVARELTKAHEELVRGPISEAIAHFNAPLGEFTVVVEIGDETKSAQIGPPEDQQVLARFGEMTERAGFSRRDAVAALAKQYGIRPNSVYAILERAKKSAE